MADNAESKTEVPVKEPESEAPAEKIPETEAPVTALKSLNNGCMENRTFWFTLITNRWNPL